MTPHRREFLRFAVGATSLPIAPRLARSQAFPNRPVRIIAGYPPGGVVDIYARLMGRWLSERLGQSFVVENRAGAAGTIAVESVVHAPADGYTLLLSSGNDAYNELIYPDIKFKYIRDIAPVAGIALSPCIMAVTPSFPSRSVPEFIAYANANPGKVNFASAGVGTTQHVSGELFKIMTGINMVHVTYRGGAPAVSDLLAGQVQLMFEFVASALPHVRSEGLRALGVTSSMRLPSLPDLPTVGEFLPGFETGAWFGLAAPKQTPAEIVEKLNREVNAILNDSRVKSRIDQLGGDEIRGSPAEFEKFVLADSEKWSKVIRAAGIKAG
jgi:tripartite-type tricarboxylate transporter receptor subunit TctC